ncbi:MAG: CoA-binding protein [Siphonobacter sp.]
MKTLVIGASPNPDRYSFVATNRLLAYGHEVILLGKEKGSVAGIPIQQGQPPLTGIDTVTLYLNPVRQKDLYEYILSLNPRRIIFNPGTENSEFEALAGENNVETHEACTLVMLATNQY